MQKFALVAIIACITVGTFASASRRYVEFTEPKLAPAGWRLVGDAPSSHTVKLTFALKQSNIDILESTFWAVSDPTSDSYGEHLSFEQVNRLIAPSPKSIELVLDFLAAHGITDVDLNIAGDFITARTSVAVAEQLLQCNFRLYEHRKDGERLVRAPRYSLPNHIADVVQFVGGVIRFPGKQVAPVVRENIDAHIEVTPRVLRKRYNLTDVEGKATNNSQAIAQFLKQYFSDVDLQEFWLEFFPTLLGAHVDKLVGPNHFPSGVESSLDVQYVMAMGARIKTWVWSTGGLHDNQEPFLEWMQLMANTSEVPWVVSVSYGDDEDSLSGDYMQRINVEFMKAGVRGISVLFASGDDGVGGNDDVNGCTAFGPNFPASSPYVTAVGGSAFSSLLEENKEVVNGLSGGGFSNVFARPAYQSAAVAKYFQVAKDLPSPSLYNHTGRGYPDVAAMSEGFTVVCNLIPVPGVAGTSCASPTFAGVIGMVNDMRLQNNKAPLGFLNPFLYQGAIASPDILFDVTEGANPGCGTDGFWAAPGWDPSSGLGTPNYEGLIKYGMMVAK
eukprot:TRINITY_DN15208_c0_g1_i1.p1 TRINITY_DN15208_c0_g1~~TRINITY_DN15208_c0_g1_i1.p1  ORF type:complete len:557 (-),score=165.69 TRINITY_DN15208_c0_g1_i1:19-1689(-)